MPQLPAKLSLEFLLQIGSYVKKRDIANWFFLQIGSLWVGLNYVKKRDSGSSCADTYIITFWAMKLNNK